MVNAGPGRPIGSKTTTLIVEVPAVPCPKCGSYERTPYEWSRGVDGERTLEDGTVIVFERRKKCRCLDCKEPRIESHYQTSPSQHNACDMRAD